MTTIDMTNEFMGVKEAASELTVSERTVYRLVADKKLQAVSITGLGGCVRIYRSSIEDYKRQLLDVARYGESAS